MENILNTIEKILKKDSRIWSDDKKPKLLKSELISLLVKDDEILLGFLINNKEIEKQFFKKVGKATIFKKDRFIQLVTMNEFLPSSFTSFEIKIGLTKNEKLFLQNDDISLVFPHKDCILEGGQTKEEQKRDEIFYNTILAPNEVDRLKEPKVFTNAKRISKDGEKEITEIKETDNMIIKGNNLLALYSLLPKYRGKVKLIYIDPPYNTGNDGFKYNDNFNHSSWLTFMKNRLEVSRDLLRDDGVIFVQCDDNEQAYLKVLMDEIFGREKSDCMIWRKSGVGRDGKMKNTTTFRKDHEYLVIAFKNEKKLNKSLEKPNWENKQINPDNDLRGNWLSGSISRTEECSNKKHKNYYSVKSKSGKIYIRQFDVSKDEFIRLDKDNRISWGLDGSLTPRIKIFENEKRLTNTSSMILFNGTSTEGKKEIENLFKNIKEFTTPKPEKLLQKIIHIATKKNDIILDFFSGSGTTGAVAHKMNRQYILIEQMDYIHNLPEARLKKVIAGEQGGISKAENWKGGGSFVYTELLEWNKKYIDLLEKAKKDEDIEKIRKQIEKEQFYKYQINLAEFDEKEFSKLSLKDKKEVLINMLDLNHLYVNINSIDDATFKVSNKDKELNKNFYNYEK